MRRRDLIAMVGAATIARPRLAAAVERSDRARRVAVLVATAQDDPETKDRVEGLSRGLRDAGWIEGRTILLDYRFSGGDIDRMKSDVRAAVDSAPDLIVVHSNPLLAALRQIDRSIPTVFVQVGDPVGSGFVDSLAHPGGNLTGFTSFEPGIGGKWLETLTDVAPSVARVLVLVEPGNKAHPAFLRAVRSAASARGVALADASVPGDDGLEAEIARFASMPHGGLIVLPSPYVASHREQISALAARYRLPAVYAFRFFVASGGLVSYGVDSIDLYRRAASYVDLILKGAKPGDLPVQQPSKYQLVIGLKSAKALGLAIPESVIARADEVIE
jgi:putative ABC transport system substrate-binding protein